MRPRWLKKRGKKNPFEASMPIDKPEFKLVEARYNNQPFFIARGVSTRRELRGEGEVHLSEGVKGAVQSEKELTWQCFWNLGALPTGFMPEGKLKEWVSGTISTISGSTADVDLIDFIERDTKLLRSWTLDDIENRTKPLLLGFLREKYPGFKRLIGFVHEGKVDINEEAWIYGGFELKDEEKPITFEVRVSLKRDKVDENSFRIIPTVEA